MTPPDFLRRTRLRLPIRLKLATVSAAFTFIILLLFAVVVGVVSERKLHGGFDNDLRATAADLQERIRVRADNDGRLQLVPPTDIVRAAAAGGAVIRVLDRNGQQLAATRGAPDLGPPVDGVRDVPGYRVVSRPLFVSALGRAGPFEVLPPPVDGAVAFVQYGKPESSVNGTLARVRLFLALGVLGGTGLAFFAGFLVARRAMRPIAGPHPRRARGGPHPRPRRRAAQARGQRRGGRAGQHARGHAQGAGRRPRPRWRAP